MEGLDARRQQELPLFLPGGERYRVGVVCKPTSQKRDVGHPGLGCFGGGIRGLPTALCCCAASVEMTCLFMGGWCRTRDSYPVVAASH